MSSLVGCHAHLFRESLPGLDPGHRIYHCPTAKRQGRDWNADGQKQLEDICAEEPAVGNLWLVCPLEDTALKKGLLRIVSESVANAS